MIIGISGRIGAGKDALAQFIQEIEPAWEIRKFAGKLKQVASILSGVDPQKFEDQEFKKNYMSPDWGMTYREFLQKLGTDAVRNGLHTNAWVNALMSEYDGYTEKPHWLVTDARFPNEADAIKKRGGVIVRVFRQQLTTTNIDLHPSETSLDDYPFDVVVKNTGSLDDLREQTKLLLTIV